MCVCVCVYVCVCVCERERERQRERERDRDRDRENVHVCTCDCWMYAYMQNTERERERECDCVCIYICKTEGVCEREREREKLRQWQRKRQMEKERWPAILTDFLRICTTSSSFRICSLPTFCGQCFTDVPHTRALHTNSKIWMSITHLIKCSLLIRKPWPTFMLFLCCEYAPQLGNADLFSCCSCVANTLIN